MLQRLAAALIGSVMLGTMAHAQDNAGLVDRELLREEIRAYLVEHPEVILEAVEILQERREAAAAAEDETLVAENAKALFADGHSFVGGNPDGAITLVEFLDYQCGYCKRAHADVAALVAGNPDIRFVVKEFPILGPESVAAARAAMAVLKNDGPEVYARFSDAMMGHDGRLNGAVIDRIAADSGADVDAMKALADGAEVTAAIRANLDLAKVLQISGTPTFVVGDRMLRGMLPADTMQKLVDEARDAL